MKHLDRKISSLELSIRLSHCLEMVGMEFLGEVVQHSEAQWLRVRHMGRRTVEELKQVLDEHDLQLGLSLPHWSRPDRRPVARLPE